MPNTLPNSMDTLHVNFVVQWLRRWVCMRFALGSNPGLTSGLDLFPVAPDSTLPRFINRQLVGSCQLGILIMFLLSLNCFFQIIKKWGACKLA